MSDLNNPKAELVGDQILEEQVSGNTVLVPEPVKTTTPKLSALLVYLSIGVYLGIIFTQSQVISWFRIQEMFRFQSFYMYGVIGGAVAVAALSVYIIKKLDVKDSNGNPIDIPPKMMDGFGTRYWLGGTFFGIGWAIAGACPGPMFALIGHQVWPIMLVIVAALAGTWTYAWLRPSLPH